MPSHSTGLNLLIGVTRQQIANLFHKRTLFLPYLNLHLLREKLNYC